VIKPQFANDILTDAMEAAQRTFALATDKSLELELQALYFAEFVKCDTIARGDACDFLLKIAENNGLCATPRAREDVEHIVREGLAGRPAGVGYTQTARDKHGDAEFAEPIISMNVYDFLATKFPPRELMLTPWLPCKGLALVYALRGVGKTHIALGVGWAVATATGFLRWTAPAARRVLLVDGEMPAELLQERLRRVSGASATQPAEWNHLRIVAADFQKSGLPDLASPNAQQFYEPLIADRDLIIIDNLSTICRGMKENEADSWVPLQTWALSLRRAGKSALFFHHGGKSGQQRGTSRKEDVMDTVMALRHPPDYSPQDGARFEIHFEKNRGFHGPDTEPFEAKLIGDQWQISSIKTGDDVDTLKTLRKLGMSIRDIADRTGVPRSTVARKLGVDE
jgi:putative DNA primase/helicase